jgi:hypothetical protein
MKQMWIVYVREGDKVVLNIMTDLQRNEMLSSGKKNNTIMEFRCGCDEIRIKNIDMTGHKVSSANYFDRIILGEEAYRVDEKGSIIYTGKGIIEGD